MSAIPGAARGVNLTIRGSVAWMVAGASVYAGCQWLIAIVLARLGGPEAVGVFAFGTALAMPFVVASQLGLRQVLISDIDQRYAFEDYYRLRAFMAAVAFTIVAAVAFLLGFQGEALIAVAGIAAARAVETVSDIHYARLQRDDRLSAVAQFTMLRGALCLAAVATVFALTLSIAAAGVAFALACAASVLFVDGAQSIQDRDRRRRGRWKMRYALSLAFRSLPLAASQVLNNVNVNVPRYVLAAFGGTALLGHYAVLEHFVAAGGLLVTSIGQAVATPLSRAQSKGDTAAFSRLTVRAICVVIAIGALGFAASLIGGPHIVGALYGPAFAPAADAMAWVMFAAIFSYATSLLGYVLPSTGAFHGLAWRQAAVTAVTVVLSLLLAPLDGIAGVAVAIAAGQAIGMGLLLNRLFDHRRTS